jgi:hypothetical protein
MNSQHTDDDQDDDADELEHHGLALHQLIQDYMDEHDLSDEAGAVLLLEISVRMRMVGYALGTEKPSAAGLKMDLDRFNRDIGDCIRAAKKSAEGFVEEAMALRDAAEDEIDDEAEDGQKDERGAPS